MTEPTGWNKNTVYALSLYKYVAENAGLWPLDNRKTLRVSIVTIMHIVTLIVIIKDWIIKGNCGSITEMVDAFALFTLSLMNLIKIILSRRHQTKITSIFHSAVQDWVDTENQKDVRIMIHHAYVGRIVCIVQMIGAYLAVVPMILMHFPSSFETYDSNNDTIIVRSVPVGPKCWLPSDISFTTYLGYYSLICVQLFLLANMFLGVDVFAFGLAMHLCGQFQVLNRSLGEFDGGEPVFEQKIKVSKFARRHYSLLQLADDFEVAFNM
ncbi:uncharacterized protein [Fopius arisanus]|uniref:Odorant receptor n=1 Tax=Fopius arisanus TaxID=64838 RepID=A0A9R1TXX5_9HYME|nr:PREDICTED: uncharacterized protein LOC105264737 [Fopius arisanus]